MLQPFEEFKFEYIDKLVHLKKRYLVSQTYHRAINHFVDPGEAKTNLLVTDYDDPGLAKTHLNAVKSDRYAAILDLENTGHRGKLAELLAKESKFDVYWAVVKSTKELEDRVNNRYKDNMRRYIEKNTNWRIGRDTTIRPAIQLIFGELYLILKYSKQTLRIKFEDIEKI